MDTMMFGVWWTILTGCSADKDSGAEPLWESAPLAELSGTCPTIDGSRAVQTFTSSGIDREVQFVLPSNPTPGIQPVFFFHGLMPEGSNPTNQMITSLSLQEEADQHNIVFILPVSQIWELVGQRFHLWNIEQGTEADDLTLYDDLRTCLANHFDVQNSDALDLDASSVMGFSGGALFTTVVRSNRPDTLASVVEMSGGADLQVPGFSNPFSVHNPGTRDVPTLLVSGGESDVWPNASFTVVDFDNASQHLFTELQAAEHTSVLCTHSNGHTITPRSWNQALYWITNHSFTETSEFQEPISDWSDWCIWE